MSRLALLVHFTVQDGAFDDFLTLVTGNALASLANEPGCRRFDVLVPEGPRDRVALYEIYDDRRAFEAHLNSAHYRRFAAAAADLVKSKEVVELSLHLDSDRSDRASPAPPGAARRDNPQGRPR